jgi:uncharacterized membrane protein
MVCQTPTRKSERGYVSLFAAIAIVALAGFAGLAIDSGYMETVRRRAQTAADSAALAAAFELSRGHREGLAEAATNDAALNGFVDGRERTTVAVASPPRSGRFEKNQAAVEAVVTQVVPTSFMMILGQPAVTVSARAVALVNGRPRLAE